MFDTVIPTIRIPKDIQVWKTEILAGAIGGVLVIPQGIMFAYLAGLEPLYGIYTAIFVTFFCSFFGSSSMISGPNTAVAILIGIAVLPLAGRGSPMFIDYVMLLTLMVGLIQLIFWFFKGEKIFQHVSPAAISGISAGAGFLIVMSSLDGIFGLSSFQTNFFFEKLYVLITEASELINPYSFAIASTTILAGFYSKKFYPKLFIIISIIVGYLTSMLIDFVWPHPTTELEYLGHIKLNWQMFGVPNLSTDLLLSGVTLIPYAFVIAFIGLAQSLVIARSLQINTQQNIVLSKEVFSQGATNTLAPFFLSFAGSGSFNRTDVNQSIGSSSNISGMLTALSVLLLIALLEPFIAYITMSVMAGTLFIVGINMLKWKEIVYYSKVRSELVIYLLTVLTVVTVGLGEGVGMAIFLSIAVFTMKISSLDISETTTEQHTILKIRGALYYASIGQLKNVFKRFTASDIIVDLQQTSFIDRPAIEFIASESMKLKTNSYRMILILPHFEQHPSLTRIQTDNLLIVNTMTELELIYS